MSWQQQNELGTSAGPRGAGLAGDVALPSPSWTRLDLLLHPSPALLILRKATFSLAGGKLAFITPN